MGEDILNSALQRCSTILKGLELIQIQKEQRGVSTFTVLDPKAVPGKLLELPGLPLPKPSIAGDLEDFCQFSKLRSGLLLRGGVLLQNRNSRLTEYAVKLCLKFWEHLVQ